MPKSMAQDRIRCRAGSSSTRHETPSSDARPSAHELGIATLTGTTAAFLLVRYIARDRVQRALYGRFARLRAFDERLGRNGSRSARRWSSPSSDRRRRPPLPR